MEKRVRDRRPIRANTFGEVRRGLKNLANDLEPELKIDGEKWEPGHLLEALAADALTMDRAEVVRRALRGQIVIEAIRLREKEGEPMTIADAPKGGEGAASPPKGTAVVRPPSVASGSLERAPRKNDQATKPEPKGGRRPLGK